MVVKADRSNKDGTHWWSILDLHPRREIFPFDSIGLTGLKSFVIQSTEKLSVKFSSELKSLKRLTKT